jgi:hypothetical protein
MNAQHSEGPSHQETDSTVQNLHTHNILKDLHIRDLWHCARCVQHSQRSAGHRINGIIKDVHKKHSERPSLQEADGIFLETEDCEGSLSCIKIIMEFIRIRLLTVTQNKV